MKKQYKYISVLSIITLLIIATTSSYALWIKTEEQTSTNLLESDCINIDLTDEGAITLNESSPVPDEVGQESTPYVFTITNTCNTLTKAKIKIKVDTANSTMSIDAISTSINKSTPKALSSITNEDNTYHIFTTSLKKDESKTFEYRMWINETATSTNSMNKTFKSNILVEYEALIEEPSIEILTNNYMPLGSGGYTTSLDCTNGTITYDEKINGLNISQLGEDTKCTITYTIDTSLVDLTDHIISLEGSDQIGTGTVTNELGYRYQGKNPNNYIWFNNELWRILGVFDIQTDTGTTETLTKIIKDTPLEASVYDANEDNTWEGSDVEIRLNDYYYNSTDATGTSHCKILDPIIDMNCDYTTKGIKPNYQNLIQSVKWPIGKYSSEEATSSDFHTAEQTATWTGNIGLMTVSDYGLTTLSSNCSRTTNLFNYDVNACGGSTWIEKNVRQWTITGVSGDDNSYLVFVVEEDGIVRFGNVTGGFSLSPSIYLKSNTKYIGGDGTQSNPIIIN